MHPFQYDRFQEEAISTIREGISVFVSAPTGAGKTVIAEVAVEAALEAGGMAIYTAPVKALSNQKFRDFHARYKERVGILTGDITLNPDAPLLIMTTEIYRNTLFEKKSRFSRCRWIIFDEVHYLDDPERGTVWEEALLLTPRETEILALSATIPNAQQLAAWIEQIHGRPVKVIQDAHRPVPLQYTFQCHNQLFSNLNNLKTQGYHGKDQLGGGRQSVRGGQPFRMGRHRGGRYYFKKRSAGLSPIPAQHHGQSNRADYLVKAIFSAERFPCLYFTFSRRRVEALASEFARMDLVSPEIREKLLTRFNELCKRYELTHERSAVEMQELVAQGVAFHHAGLLPTLKEVVEVLFTSRLIRVIVTTETFALGINMPARSVVLDTLARRAGGPRTVLKIRELSQMAGRAGRRGMDEKGFVYLRVNPWEIPFSQLQNLLHGKPEQVSSRFGLTYATLLNLYKHYGEDILPFYQKTLHAFQTSKIHQREAMNLIDRKLSLLKKLGYLQPSTPPSPQGAEGMAKGKLTPKGEFANTLYGYELLLSELFETGWLDSLNLIDLGIFLIAVVYEPRRGTGPPPRLPRRLHRLVDEVNKVLETIHQEERKMRVGPLSSKPAFQLSSAMERWVNGGSFEEVVELAGTDEGELIRYFRMSIQLARALALSTTASKSLQEKAGQLIRKINRDVVDAEAELRRSL